MKKLFVLSIVLLLAGCATPNFSKQWEAEYQKKFPQDREIYFKSAEWEKSGTVQMSGDKQVYQLIVNTLIRINGEWKEAGLETNTYKLLSPEQIKNLNGKTDE